MILMSSRISNVRCIPATARTDLGKEEECGSRLELGDRVWIDAGLMMYSDQSLIRSWQR